MSTVVKKHLTDLVAPYRAHVAAIRPAPPDASGFDLIAAALSGKSMGARKALDAKMGMYSLMRDVAITEIATIEREIVAGRPAPVQQLYINLWRYHADLAIATAFLDAVAACNRYLTEGFS